MDKEHKQGELQEEGCLSSEQFECLIGMKDRWYVTVGKNFSMEFDEIVDLGYLDRSSENPCGDWPMYRINKKWKESKKKYSIG